MRFFFTFLLFVFAFVASNATADEETTQPQNIQSITVLAPSSLTVALAEISRNYARNKLVDVNAVFQASPEIIQKIEDGDPGDIIITPNSELMDEFQEKGLIDVYSRKILAENRLALVTSKKFEVRTESNKLEDIIDDINRRELMVIANPQDVILGQLSVDVLKNIERWNKVKRFMLLAPTSSKTADLISKSQKAGIVYASDAKLYSSELDYVGHVPKSLHAPVRYHAAAVVGDNMEKSRTYLDYLASNQAQAVFREYGLLTPKDLDKNE